MLKLITLFIHLDHGYTRLPLLTHLINIGHHGYTLESTWVTCHVKASYRHGLHNKITHLITIGHLGYTLGLPWVTHLVKPNYPCFIPLIRHPVAMGYLHTHATLGSSPGFYELTTEVYIVPSPRIGLCWAASTTATVRVWCGGGGWFTGPRIQRRGRKPPELWDGGGPLENHSDTYRSPLCPVLSTVAESVERRHHVWEIGISVPGWVKPVTY